MERTTDLFNKKILIITGGYINEEFLASLYEKERYSLVIAVDRGLIAADRIKLRPDYILGDFDSIPIELLSEYKSKKTPIETFPMMKDKTDTHIAIEMALKKKPSLIDLVGATGSRMDHTISNVGILMLALNNDVDARILDENNCIYLKKKSFTIKKSEQKGDYISLVAFSQKVKGLKLQGFKYPLNGITLSSGESLGISNELISDEGRVEFEDGILTVFETKD